MNLTGHVVMEDGEQIFSVKPCATGSVDLNNIMDNVLSFHGTDETDDDRNTRKQIEERENNEE